MIIEMRTYKTAPGRRSEFLDIFRKRSVPAHSELGETILGPFISVDDPDTFFFMRGFPSDPSYFRTWSLYIIRLPPLAIHSRSPSARRARTPTPNRRNRSRRSERLSGWFDRCESTDQLEEYSDAGQPHGSGISGDPPPAAATVSAWIVDLCFCAGCS